MRKINDYNKQFSDYLLYRNYGRGTVKSYTRIVEKFLRFSAENRGLYSTPQAYAYQYMVMRKGHGMSASTINTIYSAIKLFFKHVLKQAWNYDEVPRPKHLKTLPYVLSQEQVQRLLESIRNAKHQTVVLLLYSCGLRVSEVLHLRPGDILWKQSILCIRQAKGQKDRMVDLPELTKQALKSYINEYRPSAYLIEGQQDGQPYSASSIRHILQRGADRAGLGVKVYPHLLRHTYATHHLDSGTDIVLIKQQLGHASLQVTARYLHLCKRRPKTIHHPIDTMRVQLRLMVSESSSVPTAKTTSEPTSPPLDTSSSSEPSDSARPQH